MSSSSSSGARQFFKPFFVDDYMAGGTGHLALASAFEWLASGLRNFKQALPCFGFDNLHCRRRH